MAQQISVEPGAVAASPAEHGLIEATQTVAYQRHVFVNTVLVGAPRRAGWVLVDTGIPGVAHRILRAAGERFGTGNLPCAIVLTHGHFDHVGTLEQLAAEWNVPVFAHALERPYLDGTASYPPADSSVGGGVMAMLSPLFPRKPVDVSDRLTDLPADGSVPVMPGWRSIHTPGHSAGHVSFWHEEDRILIVGDAFITTAGESAYASLTQAPELHGPPRYFTPDWEAAARSVRVLAALEPEIVVTGHGRAMRGAAMRQALHTLAERFETVAVPPHGRYVGAPSTGASRAAQGGRAGI